LERCEWVGLGPSLFPAVFSQYSHIMPRAQPGQSLNIAKSNFPPIKKIEILFENQNFGQLQNFDQTSKCSWKIEILVKILSFGQIEISVKLFVKNSKLF